MVQGVTIHEDYCDLDVIVAGEANVDLMMLGVPRVEFDKELPASDMSLVLGGSSSIAASICPGSAREWASSAFWDAIPSATS